MRGDGSGESTATDDPSGELTLVFELSALRQLSHPEAVFEDARQWSRYVGIVTNDHDALESFLDRHDVRSDFEPGDRDKWLAMQEIRRGTATPRHVFVGTSPEDRRIADQLDWEFRPLSEAARLADWEREPGEDDRKSVVDRVRNWISGIVGFDG